MTRLILVRHGETDWNRQRRFQGLSGIELNELGRRQAEALALTLKDEGIAAIYSSPLRRALETAQIIARSHRMEVVTLDGLRELDIGELNGLTYEEARGRYDEFFEKWLRDAAVSKVPGGESLLEARDRAWAAIQWILAKHHDQAIVVSHHFVLLAIISKALGLDLSEFRRLRMELAAISILDFDGQQATLLLANDTCHLKKELG